MIYLPNIYELDETETELYQLSVAYFLEHKYELSFDDRIDIIMLMLDHVGYTFEEYAEERRRYSDWKKVKKEYNWKGWNANGTTNKDTLS